jgi:hypothetical protein
MLAGHFDPGPEDMRVRSLVGHTIAVYEPDASLSLVWPVPEDDEVRARGRHSDDFPQWAADDLAWDSAHLGYVVVLLSGSPIWQEPLWLLDWGSGTAGYVAAFEPIHSQDRVAGEAPRLEGWEASAWSVGVARLLNELSITGDFHEVDPTDRIVPERSTLHPIEASRARLR